MEIENMNTKLSHKDVEVIKENSIIKAPGLTTDDQGALDLISLDSKIIFAKRLMVEKMVSTTFKTPQQIIIGMEYANALAMPVVPALKMMYIIQGKPCIYGDGPLILVQRSKLFESIIEYEVDKDFLKICVENKNIGKPVFASVCEVKRKGDPETQVDYFSINDMNKAGLNSVVWNKYQRIMLRYKARSMALKSKFADLLNGIDIAEHHYESLPTKGIVEVESQNIDDINAQFAPKKID